MRVCLHLHRLTQLVLYSNRAHAAEDGQGRRCMHCTYCPRSSIKVCKLLFSTHARLRSVHRLHGGPRSSMMHLIWGRVLVSGLRPDFSARVVQVGANLLFATGSARLHLARDGRRMDAQGRIRSSRLWRRQLFIRLRPCSFRRHLRLVVVDGQRGASVSTFPVRVQFNLVWPSARLIISTVLCGSMERGPQRHRLVGDGTDSGLPLMPCLCGWVSYS